MFDKFDSAQLFKKTLSLFKRWSYVFVMFFFFNLHIFSSK